MITVVADEASESQERFALYILLILQMQQNEPLQPYLAEVKFLESTNATTVSQSKFTCPALSEIPYDSVSALISDNAAYMSKAFQLMQGTMPNAVHITCNQRPWII